VRVWGARGAQWGSSELRAGRLGSRIKAAGEEKVGVAAMGAERVALTTARGFRGLMGGRGGGLG